MKSAKLLLLALAISVAPAPASPASDEVELGNQLAREGLYDSALIFYNKALKIDPYFQPALNGKQNCSLHLKGGKPVKGKKATEAATTKETPAQSGAGKPESESAKAALAARQKSDKEKAALAAKQQADRAKAALAAKQQADRAKAALTAKRQAERAKAALAAKQQAGAHPETSAGKTPAASVQVAQPSWQESNKPPADTASTSAEQHLDTSNPFSSHSQDSQASSGTQAPSPSSGSIGAILLPVVEAIAAPFANQIKELPEQAAPSWFINMTWATLALMVVLTLSWLMPTMSASKQLSKRLKHEKR